MGNTANNNWPYPESTDLVKDGATAIENLADAIDTTLGVYSDPGLVLLNTTSFSAVASQSINDVFSATYDNYLIMLNISTHSAADKNINLRYRVSGADNSTGNYFERFVGYTDFNATDNFRNSSATSSFIMPLNSGENDFYATKIEVFDPFATLRTKTLLHMDGVVGASGAQVTFIGGGVFNATTSFTGFTFFTSTGDITGSVSVYGYNK
jgi:hypothetical protein